MTDGRAGELRRCRRTISLWLTQRQMHVETASRAHISIKAVFFFCIKQKILMDLRLWRTALVDKHGIWIKGQMTFNWLINRPLPPRFFKFSPPYVPLFTHSALSLSVVLFSYQTLKALLSFFFFSFPSLPPSLPQELCLFHGWEVVICYRRLGRQRGLPLIWTGDHQENHIRGKACLNIAVIAAIISRCLFGPHLSLQKKKKKGPTLRSTNFLQSRPPLQRLSPPGFSRRPPSFPSVSSSSIQLILARGVGSGADSCMTRNVSLCKSLLPPRAVLA